MDDLKLYGGSREEVEGLVGVVKKFSDDIGIGVWHCEVCYARDPARQAGGM